MCKPKPIFHHNIEHSNYNEPFAISISKDCEFRDRFPILNGKMLTMLNKRHSCEITRREKNNGIPFYISSLVIVTIENLFSYC